MNLFIHVTGPQTLMRPMHLAANTTFVCELHGC